MTICFRVQLDDHFAQTRGVRIPTGLDRPFRPDPITDSGRTRSLIPADPIAIPADPITRSGGPDR